MNETLETIYKRKSCRDYLPDPLDEETLKAILEAGIQAPSAMNRQQCEAFAVTNKELIDELVHELNVVFAERGEKKPENYHCAYHAPVLVIVSGPEYESRRIEDGNCLLENIFLAATSLNVGSCWINQLRDTQNVEEVRNVLTKIGLPVNHQVVGCAALGYVRNEGPRKEKKLNRYHIIK